MQLLVTLQSDRDNKEAARINELVAKALGGPDKILALEKR